MKKDETFEEWVKENYGFNPSEKDVNFMMHRESWDYQQNKIQDLEAKLTEAVEALTSIACLEKQDHDTAEFWITISHKECSETLATDTKIARQTLAQIGEKGEGE